MLNEKGQAYSTFKLLIAAIVAMAILAILIPIIMQVMGLIKADPLEETKSMMSSKIAQPGALEHTKEVVFTPNYVLTASALSDRLPISKDQICMSTGEFTEDDGFECLNCDEDEQHRIRYNGSTEKTAQIAIVCNVDKDELLNDIDVYEDDLLEGDGDPDIEEACDAICSESAKCCALVLTRS